MSMMRCETCDRYIDTDYDVECFVADSCICGRCQEGMLDDGRLIEINGELVRAVPGAPAEDNPQLARDMGVTLEDLK